MSWLHVEIFNDEDEAVYEVVFDRDFRALEKFCRTEGFELNMIRIIQILGSSEVTKLITYEKFEVIEPLLFTKRLTGLVCPICLVDSFDLAGGERYCKKCRQQGGLYRLVELNETSFQSWLNEQGSEVVQEALLRQLNKSLSLGRLFQLETYLVPVFQVDQKIPERYVLARKDVLVQDGTNWLVKKVPVLVTEDGFFSSDKVL